MIAYILHKQPLTLVFIFWCPDLSIRFTTWSSVISCVTSLAEVIASASEEATSVCTAIRLDEP